MTGVNLQLPAWWLVLWPYTAAVLGFALAVLLFAYMLRQHERQSASIAWVLAFVLAPFIAVPAYILFAGRKLAARARAKTPLHDSRGGDPVPLAPPAAAIESIARGSGLPAARGGNRVEFLSDGAAAFEALMALVDGARERVHVSTFIFSADAVGRVIAERLARRAEEGIEVRLLVDAIGSLPARFTLLPALRRRGVRVGVFMPMLSLHRRSKANLRNHRKLVVADGRTAIAGGMNLGSDYMGPGPGAAPWIDTTLHLQGPVVADLEAVFAADWAFTVGESLPAVEPRAADAPGAGGTGGLAAQVIQVVPSGPDVVHDALYDAVVAAVYRATRRIWVVTPYFVPDEGLMRALTLQARVGVDVRLLLPARSNHLVADMARARYLRELSEAGVRLYYHPHRMVHAKHLLIDDTLAVAGSVNLDMRSLYLNYEVALFGYDPLSIARQVDWMEAHMAQCHQVKPPTPGLLRRLGEDVCWLAAPLL